MKFGAQFIVLALAASNVVEAVALPNGPSGSAAAVAIPSGPHHYRRADTKTGTSTQTGTTKKLKTGTAVKGKKVAGRMRSARTKEFDPKAATNIAASKKKTFHFVGEPDEEDGNQRFAKVDFTFKAPSVDLMDAEVIESMTCTPESMEIVFKTDEAFKVAEDTWPKNGQDFFLVSYKGCGAGAVDEDGDDKFMTKILDLTLDKTKRLAIAQYKDIKMGDAVDSGVVGWGQRAAAPGTEFKTVNITNAEPTTVIKDKKPTQQQSGKKPDPYMGLGFLKFFGEPRLNPKTGKVEQPTVKAARRRLLRRDETAVTTEDQATTGDQTATGDQTTTEDQATTGDQTTTGDQATTGDQTTEEPKIELSTETVVINDQNFGVGVGLLWDNDGNVSPDQRQCPNTKATDVDESSMDGTDFYDLTKPENQEAAEDGLLPDIADNTPSQKARRARMLRRMIAARAELHRRWTLWGVIKSACEFVMDVPAQWAGEVFDDAIKAVQGAYRDAVDYLEDSGRRLYNGQHKFNTANTNLVFDFPNEATLTEYNLPVLEDDILNKFGADNGFLVKKIDNDQMRGALYCLDCGVKGNLRFDGQVTFSAANGIEEAYLEIDGQMDIGIQLGLDVQGYLELSHTVDIFRVMLGPGIKIPGIIEFAPMLSTAAWFDMRLVGSAQMNAGIRMKWDSPKARLDLVAATATQSGWEPQIEKIFNYNVRLNAAATAEFPVTFGLSMDILSGTWKHAVELVENPQLRLWTGPQAKIPVDGKLVSDIGFEDEKCSNGLPVHLQFQNELYFNGLPKIGDSTGQLAIWNIPKQPLLRACLPAGSIDSTIDGTTLTEGSPINQGEALTWALTKEIEPITKKRKRNTKAPRGTSPTGEVESRQNGAPSSWSSEDPAIASAEQGTFANTFISSTMDGSYLATTSKGLVYLDSNKKGRNCGQPANWLMDPASGAIVGDAGGRNRLLHAYSNEFQKYGVSRLRVHAATSIPKTAEVIFLKGNQNGDLFGIIPGDEGFDPYFLIACEVQNQPTKLFVSQLQVGSDGVTIDAETTIETVLKNPANEAKLTGGKVLGCSLKSLRITSADQMKQDFIPTSTDLPAQVSDVDDHTILADSAGFVWPDNFDDTKVQHATQLDASGQPMVDPQEPQIGAITTEENTEDTMPESPEGETTQGETQSTGETTGTTDDSTQTAGDTTQTTGDDTQTTGDDTQTTGDGAQPVLDSNGQPIQQETE
ncbi:hypothetical protein ABW19_dt0204860 [Dactylella cylindrospora]|nr:hypothetical protein ABW19_dt0204860 [Dactylella cylindrospora]